MKQKDTLLIVLVIVISAIISLVLSNALITSPKNRQAKVEIIDPISPDFGQPDSKYFNNNSVDPTKTIKIGGGGNNQPFNQ